MPEIDELPDGFPIDFSALVPVSKEGNARSVGVATLWAAGAENYMPTLAERGYLIKQDAYAFGTPHPSLANWTINDTSIPMLRTQIGKIIRVSGRFTVTLTGAGQKFVAFPMQGLDEPSISKGAGIGIVLADADGVIWPAQCGWLETNRMYITPGDMGGLASGTATVTFDFSFSE